MEEKRDVRKINIVLAIIFVASIAVIIGTVSYAYFTTDLGENTNQELVLQAGTMQMKFSDNDAGVNTGLNLGESVIKEFILENTGTLDSTAKINFTNLINTYLKESLTYKLEYKTGEESTTYIPVKTKNTNVPRSETATTEILADGLELPVGAKYYYRLTITLENLPDIDQTADLKAIFSTTFNIDEGSKPVTADTILKNFNVTAKDGNPTFTSIATTDEGVYAMADDYGTSYYYRGAVTNNYIKYGQNKSGQDMWWRIIRINGDGSLRIIYDGTQGYGNGTANDARYAITSQPWNASPNYNDAKYVGWMFGGAQGSASTSKEQAQTNETNSDAKTAVDNWYKENIVDTGYAGNVVDRVFCNDRSIDSGPGYGTTTTYYGAYARLGVKSASVVEPKFTCEEKNDAFTVEETETTNGALEYPVGLITADEIVTAGSGGYNKANSSYYLYKSSSYYGWSLSPYYGDSSNAFVFNVNTNGYLSSNGISNTSGAVAPVINLSAEYAATLRGEGTMESPYQA